ncbi:MAG: DUF2157 domain-containing protein [Candidatus Campbellbacteria bacterium]|nr:DUF2157 domain-containing protein [Candidatus Campbellbacteria bacterium]
MYKEDLLNELSEKLHSGEVSRSELESLMAKSAEVEEDSEMSEGRSDGGFSLTRIASILGAAIVITGLALFVVQIWEDIGSVARVVITLGLGFLLGTLGSVLLKRERGEDVGAAFHFLGGVLIPIGIFTTFAELGLESIWLRVIAFAVLGISYGLLSLAHKSAVLTFFAILNGTSTLYLWLHATVDNIFESEYEIRWAYQYLSMAVGIGYLVLSQKFQATWNRRLTGLLLFFGSLMFLGAAFLQAYDYFLWQLLYFPLVVGGLFLSAVIKSRIVLIFSTIFLLLHLAYITEQYFANSLGWPLSLVVLGFAFLGLSYLSVKINQEYIK